MECARFEELLFERLERLLDETRCEELAAHAAKCLRCGALEALLTMPAEAAAAGSSMIPDDFTATILALTSERDPLQRALRQLDLDLPAMASMIPDEEFVADVMTATVEAAKQRFWYRAREFWQGLLQRPRFALEGAYVGGFALFLLVGLPGSPLAGVPDQVLNELRSDDGVVRTALSEGASRVTEFSQASWTHASELASTTIANRLPRTADLAKPMAWLLEFAEAFGDFWHDAFIAAVDWLQAAWLNSIGPAPEDSTTDRTNNNHDEQHV